MGLLAADPGGLSLRTPARKAPNPLPLWEWGPLRASSAQGGGHVLEEWQALIWLCAGELWVEGAPGRFSLGKPCAVERVVHVVLASPLGLTREPDVWVGTSTRTSGLGEPSVGRAAELKANTQEAPGPAWTSCRLRGGIPGRGWGVYLAEILSSWAGACFQGP